MDLQLTKKKALVTGSTAGIGFAIATLLAREGIPASEWLELPVEFYREANLRMMADAIRYAADCTLKMPLNFSIAAFSFCVVASSRSFDSRIVFRISPSLRRFSRNSSWNRVI